MIFDVLGTLLGFVVMVAMGFSPKISAIGSAVGFMCALLMSKLKEYLSV